MRGGQRVGRVWGYCRVSSQRQEQGTSLDGQQQAIAGWCRSQGLPAPTLAVEVESGAGEKAEQRVEQRAIMREARAGDVVVVIAVDRWSRDIVHTMQSVRELTRRGVRWVALRESLDATTREGDERLGLMAWVAESERRRIHERTIGRKRELMDAGHYVYGTAPIGYVVEGRRLVPGPERAIVEELFRRCATGEGLRVIAATLPTTARRRRWDKAGLARTLRHRVYLGETQRADGTWHPTHEALVDADLWERAHAALATRRHAGRAPGDGWSAERLLRGLARCARCGRVMSVQLGRPRKGDPGRSMSYICAGHLAGQCRARHVHAERLDALADHAALARLKEIRHELARARAPEEAPPEDDGAGAKLVAAKRKRERLISLAVDGAITAEDLRARLARADAEIATLERAAAEARRRKRAAARAARPEAKVELLARVDLLTKAWQAAPVATRREVLRELAARVEVSPPPRAWTHDVVPPRIVWRSVDELLAEA